MGNRSLRDLIGLIKDTASQGKAALISNPKSLSFHLSLLRATTHDPSAPPSGRHLATLLSAGRGSRATAAAAVEAVMDRLQITGNACVALKCLVIVHHIVKHGSFILRDQLSVYPSAGGRNYLKLSDFRDDSSPLTWELSSWVRWYAMYLEHLLSTSRVLGFFLSSSSSTTEKDREEETVSTLTNFDLLKDIETLVSLVEEACKIPDLTHPQGKNLVEEITRLVGEDYLSAVEEISSRVNEFKTRLSCLGFGDSVELVCALKRLEGCKVRSWELCQRKSSLVNSFWGLINEVKGMVGNSGTGHEEGKLSITMGEKDHGSESARFGDRVVPDNGNWVRFSSGRYLDVVRFSYS